MEDQRAPLQHEPRPVKRSRGARLDETINLPRNDRSATCARLEEAGIRTRGRLLIPHGKHEGNRYAFSGRRSLSARTCPLLNRILARARRYCVQHRSTRAHLQRTHAVAQFARLIRGGVRLPLKMDRGAKAARNTAKIFYLLPSKHQFSRTLRSVL